MDVQLYADRQQSIAVFLKDDGVAESRIVIEESQVEQEGREDPLAARRVELRVEVP